MGNKNSGNRLSTNSTQDFSKLTVKCYNYLLYNFHKFSTSQKIDISKAVILKAMPSTGSNVEGTITVKFESNGFVTDNERNRIKGIVHSN